MSAKYISNNWRLLNQENSSKNDNYGLTFDGSGDFISTTLSQSGTISVSCWFYTDDASTQMAFFGAGTTNPYQIRNFGLQNGEYVVGCYTKDLTPNFRGIRYDTTAGSASYNTGQWTHFVGIIEQVTSTNANYYLYQNGILLLQTNDSYREQTTYPFFLGAMNNFGTATQLFDGSISQVSIYDYALTSTQISTLYGSSSLGSASPLALKPQPVAYYPLGDNSASNPLTQPNVAVQDATVFDFDEVDDFVDLGTTTDYDTGDLSVSIWVNASSSRTITGYAFSNSGSTSIAGFDIKIKTNEQVNVSRITRTKSCETGWLSIGFIDDAWQHLAFTYNESTNTIKLFLNGVLKDTSTGTTQTNIASKKLTIGSYKGTLNFWKGQLSNAQIWNTTLLDTEVTTLYNSGVPLYTGTQPQAANLKAWYKLNNTANWEADSSGNWQIPEATSAYPQSFEFDGVSDEITIPKGNMTDTVSKSVSMWIKNEISSGTDYIINSRTGGYLTNGISLIQTTTTGYIYSNSDNSKIYTGYQSALNIPNDGNWYHLAWTADHTTHKLKTYINGVFVYEFTGSATTDTTPSGPIIVGQSGSPWTGKLSNLQVWDDVILTDGGVALNDPATGQIAELYNNGSPLTTAIASSNLKAWYKLDNSATFSTNWSIPDDSGNGNTGTSSGMTEQNLVNNNVSALNGESSGMTSANLVTSDLTRAIPYGDGYSFNFDAASSDYINLGTPSTFAFGTGDFSISGWVYLDSSTGYQWIFSTGTNFAFGFDSSRNLQLWVGVTATSPSFNINLNQWHHVVATRNSGTVTFYIDGVAHGTTYTRTGSISAGSYNYIGTFNIGQNHIDGKISNVSLFNESLTSTEIQKLYANGVPQDLSSFTPQPQAWYPLGSNSFWNGSAWTVRDMSTGGSNDGTGQNIGADGLVGDSPRSEANGTGTNMDVPSNLIGEGGQNSNNNSWSVNMSSEARKQDTP